MQYLPTRPAIRSMDRLSLTWPQVVADLERAVSVLPCAGYDTRLVVRASTVHAFVEPGVFDQAPARFVVGVRLREATRVEDVAPVVGVEKPRSQPRGRGGTGRTWPTTWAELLTRLRAEPGVEVLPGGKHLAVTRDGVRVFTLPVSGSDYRGVRNACTQLRAAGLDLRR